MAGIKRSTRTLASPAMETDAQEAKGHHDPSIAPVGRMDGKFIGPYTTSKEEADGHGDGRAAKGNDGKKPHAGI